VIIVFRKYFFFIASVFCCTAALAQEIIKYEARSRQSLNKVRAALYIPDMGSAPYPLVITQHGSSPEVKLGKCPVFGRSEDCVKTDVFSSKLLKSALEKGFAVAVIDAFSDIGAGKDNKLAFPDATSYAHALREKLVQDARLDPERFFYTGWSYGGHSVLNTMLYRTQDRWRAIAPVEAGCQFQPAAKTLPYPVLFVMGAESHYPPKPCLYLVGPDLFISSHAQPV
jgi:predicted peptidase